MSLAVPGLAKYEVGNSAGWFLTFHRESNGTVDDRDRLVLSSSDYYASIDANLTEGLRGGSYTFVVEGLEDAAYRQLAQNLDADPAPRSVVRLYLYWHDTSSVGGYLTSLAGLTDALAADEPDPATLVAELAITSVSRRRGARRPETRITARERVFHRLTTSPLSSAINAATHLEAISKLAEPAGVAVTTYSNGLSVPPNTQLEACSTADIGDEQTFEFGQPLSDALLEIERRMVALTCKRGRRMYVIRDGELHAGVLSLPLQNDPMISVDLSSGLAEVEGLAPVISDPNSEENGERRPETRRQFKLTAKGRPDVKPGCAVTFKLPAAEKGGEGAGGPLSALLTDEADVDVEIYVTGVQHKLGRTTGFVTTITGVEIKDWNKAWDTHSLPRTTAYAAGEEAAGSDEERAAVAIRRVVRTTQDSLRLADVGEVRAVTTTGAAEPPGQTVTVWRGLGAADGRRNQARRLDVISEDPAELEGVASLTPFAWGKAGLVLPEYPGQRVALVHRNGRGDDPLVAGALWGSGEGPDSNTGDWWLILPASGAAVAALDAEEDPDPYADVASNDLIDAAGNRIIEVGELTIRITRSLEVAGERPDRGEADSVTIEHADAGSRIVMKSNGDIVIEAGRDLAITAARNVTLEANNVNVSVAGTMDVS